MRQITDEMVRTLMRGSGLDFEGFLVSLAGGPFTDRKQNQKTILNAVSNDGRKILSRPVTPVNQIQVKIEIENILQDINSSTHLPESAYSNGIRLDTEHRCQNQRCNPAGLRRLLFVSAGPMSQPMQIKCKCGWINTFWNNRIDFDEYGAIQMKNCPDV